MKNRVSGKFNIVLIITMVFFIVFPVSVYAEDDDKEIVRVGWYLQDGFQGIDGNGNPYGFDYEYLMRIENNSDLEFDYVDGKLEDLLDQLYSHQIDMIGGINYTAARDRDFLFSDVYYTDNHLIVVSKSDSDYLYDDFDSLDDRKVGIFNNEYLIGEFSDLAAENGIDYEPVVADVQSELLDGLDEGEYDFAVMDSLSYFDGYRIIGEYNLGNVYFMFNNNEYGLEEKISEVLRKIKITDRGFDDYLYDKYFDGHNEVAFSAEEKQYIEDNDGLVVGLDTDDRNSAVFSGTDDSSFGSIDYKVISSIAEYSGLDLNYELIDSDKNKVQALADGDCDIALGIIPSEKGLYANGVLLTSSYFDNDTVLLCNENADINSGLKIIVPHDDYATTDYIESRRPEWVIANDGKMSMDDAVEMLNSSDADGVMMNKYEAEYYLQIPGYHDLVMKSENGISNERSIAVSNGDSTLLSLLNKSLGNMESELSDEIESGLVNHVYEPTMIDRIISNSYYILLLMFLFVLILALFMRYDNKRIKKLEKESEEAKLKLLQAERAKSDFFARVTHDMRTPLNSTINYSNFGIEENNNSKDVSYFRLIKKSSEYLLALMNDILEIQKMDIRRVRLKRQYVDFYELADEVYMMLKDRADIKNIEFIHENRIPDYSRDRYQVMDIIRVKQILTNVISNAIKYTDEGGTVKWISHIINNIKGERLLTFYIIDNGVGMTEEFLEKMYEPFSQEANYHSITEGGVGLGMSITRNLVNAMHGKIECDSEIGRGTRFTIYIPVEFVSREEYEEQTGRKAYLAEVSLEGVRVLAAEDNFINLKILTKLLTESKIEVDVAKNGQEAVDKLRYNNYDIVLMDIRMPVMNGLKAAEEIREFNKEIPIIAVSANAFREDVRKSLEAGMNAHIAKPINKDELINTIKRFVR